MYMHFIIYGHIVHIPYRPIHLRSVIVKLFDNFTSKLLRNIQRLKLLQVL